MLPKKNNYMKIENIRKFGIFLFLMFSIVFSFKIPERPTSRVNDYENIYIDTSNFIRYSKSSRRERSSLRRNYLRNYLKIQFREQAYFRL
ncbi:MAG: hypothetical protein QXO70_02510 [Candidatus Pacearchaeota archaeon]